MGYRLPLDSLPWVTDNDYPHLIEQDPFAPRSPLPSAANIKAQYPIQPNRAPSSEGLVQGKVKSKGDGLATSALPARHESAHWITRTALCVETRDPMRANGPKAEAEHGGQSGVLYVFMPPLAKLEDYLDLLAAGAGDCRQVDGGKTRRLFRLRAAR